MFFLPPNELFFLFNKSVPRRALEQIFVFSTMWNKHMHADSQLPFIEFIVTSKKSVSQRHFIEQGCMRVFFFFFSRAHLCVHFHGSTRTVLNSIHMGNSALTSVLWLQQIAQKVYFFPWNQTLRWESLLVHTVKCVPVLYWKPHRWISAS